MRKLVDPPSSFEQNTDPFGDSSSSERESSVRKSNRDSPGRRSRRRPSKEDVTLERKERRGIEGSTAPIPGLLRIHPHLNIALATGDVSRGKKRSKLHRSRRGHEVSPVS